MISRVLMSGGVDSLSVAIPNFADDGCTLGDDKPFV